jgi:hypothetical protein
VYNNHPVGPPKTPEQGYHLTEYLTDKPIAFIADSKQVAPNGMPVTKRLLPGKELGIVPKTP